MKSTHVLTHSRAWSRSALTFHGYWLVQCLASSPRWCMAVYGRDESKNLHKTTQDTHKRVADHETSATVIRINPSDVRHLLFSKLAHDLDGYTELGNHEFCMIGCLTVWHRGTTGVRHGSRVEEAVTEHLRRWRRPIRNHCTPSECRNLLVNKEYDN